MKYKYYNDELAGMTLDHDISTFNDVKPSNQIKIENNHLGKVVIKQKSIEGVQIIEYQSEFIHPTITLDSVGDDQDYFFMFFNLGKSIESTCGENHILEGASQNLWSFKRGQKSQIEYSANSKNHNFFIALDNSYLERIVNRYPNLIEKLYKGYSTKTFLKWNKKDMPINFEMQQVLTQIQNADLMGDCRNMYIESKVNELLALQLNSFAQHKPILMNSCKTSKDVDKIHEARNLILENYNNPPGIYELSKMVGLNRVKLQIGFKEAFNQTVYSCLFEFKMNKAYYLLTETNKPIIDISIQCGYNYASHFTTAFKRRFGVTPNNFRKKSLG